jgi:hypothetical protein
VIETHLVFPLRDRLPDLLQQLLVLLQRRRNPRINQFEFRLHSIPKFRHQVLVLVDVSESVFGARVTGSERVFVAERGEKGREGRGETGLGGEHG